MEDFLNVRPGRRRTAGHNARTTAGAFLTTGDAGAEAFIDEALAHKPGGLEIAERVAGRRVVDMLAAAAPRLESEISDQFVPPSSVRRLKLIPVLASELDRPGLISTW